MDPKDLSRAMSKSLRFDVMRDAVHTAIREREELFQAIELGHLKPFDSSMAHNPAIREATLSQLRGEISILQTIATGFNSVGLANQEEVIAAIIRGYNR